MRLVSTRQGLQEELLSQGHYLIDMAPLLSKKSMTERLEAIVKTAGKLGDFDMMVLAIMPLYEHSEDVARRVGLPEGWHEVAVTDYQELGREIRVVVRQALHLPGLSRP